MSEKKPKYLPILLGILILAGLYLTSLHNYLLFHSFAEIFGIVVACGIFIVAWNSRRFLDNTYLIFIGIAYLFIGSLDLLHTLAYKGLGVFHGHDANLPTQLWIAARYVESLSLLIAPFFLGHKLRRDLVFLGYGLAICLLLGSIFLWNAFPVCFIEGTGLTPFKKISEYVISLLLLGSIALLFNRHREFETGVLRLLVASIALTVVSELAFTFYISVYGFSNLIGHYLKILSFYLIYIAIIETGLTRPYAILFRNLHESEKALRKERDFTDAILSTAGALIVVFDPEGRIMRFNRACEELTGYSFTEVMGRPFSDILLTPEEIEPVRAIFSQLRSDRCPNNHENHWVTKDGSRRLIAWSDTALLDNRGLVEYVIGTGIDITERKRTEEALREAGDDLAKRVEDRTAELIQANHEMLREMRERERAEVSLRENEERFRQLAESIDDVFWLGNSDSSEVLYVSPPYEKVWGRTCRSLYDQPRSWFETIHPEDQERVKHAVENIDTRDPELEYRIVHTDGSIRWVRSRTYPIRDESGTVYRIAGVVLDITEQKRLQHESKLREHQVIQADRLASLGQVVAGVAHEINNPSSFITYNVPLLEETWNIFEPILMEYSESNPGWRRNGLSFDELLDDMHETISAIQTGSERINRVVSDLKDFGKPDEGALTKPFDVNQVVEKTLTIVGAQLRKTVGKTETHLARDLPEIIGHPHKLEQVLANLLLNASQAIPSKSEGRISILTRYLDRLGAVLIQVEDNGKGMARDVVDRIFDPFFTTRREGGGTGLGLSVSYGLVQEHHGRLGVLSRPGLGSRFTVYLPVDNAAKLDLRPTILCVDSKGDLAKNLQFRLNGDGETPVETISDPERIIPYMDEHPEVDIVVSKIMLPGMGGRDPVEKIKPRFPLVAVILLSNHPGAFKREPDGSPQPDFLLDGSVQIDQLVQIINTIERQRL